MGVAFARGATILAIISALKRRPSYRLHGIGAALMTVGSSGFPSITEKASDVRLITIAIGLLTVVIFAVARR